MRKTRNILVILAVLAVALPLISQLLYAPPAVAQGGQLVCIDAGHGGSDPGAVANGLEEKEINLDVAMRARSLLESMGYRVIMTRESDVDVSLADRCDIANNAGANVFVSVHNNAVPYPEGNGTETYCYYGSFEGWRLATFVHQELIARLGRHDRGIKEAGFYPIKYTNMPAILIEGAFLTNPEEAELLKDSGFRQRMAESVATGVNQYFLDPGTEPYVFKGRGRAHGVGLCMDGVYYRALEGQSYHDIINHYYTGVQFGKTDENQPIRVKCRDGQIRTYTMRDYLYRLAEEPETYPSEGLKVLYVAARTYTLSCIARGKHHDEGFDVCSSGSCCQAFDENKDLSQYPNNCAAVDATAGEIITYDGQPIIAAYHGSCGGHTENNEDVWGGSPIPYLRGKPCGYCHNSERFEWEVRMTRAEVEYRLNSSPDTQVGTLLLMDLSDRTQGGRVDQAIISGVLGVKTVSGSTLAARLGLSSSLFYLDRESAAQSSFFFAEGYTGGGCQEYLCIGNPNGEAAATEVTYMFNDGSTHDETYVVPPTSRYTVNVGERVGQEKEVSVEIRSESTGLITERPMYLAYHGVWASGHNAMGSTAPAKRWYFAEGTTLPEFDEWITIQNPGSETASLDFRYMVEGQGEEVHSAQVGPRSRATFSAEEHVGEGKNVSLLIESDQDIVAERPLYFDYEGLGGHSWRGGHCVPGKNEPADHWYFAEGTTRDDNQDGRFEEWLCIQNPNGDEITVDARYVFCEGQGEPLDVSYKVPAKQRLTVSVNEQVGPGKDVSVELTSDSPFIAERPVYFLYHGAWDGGDNVMGANSTATNWFFAEGYTGPGFEQWLCVQNPGSEPAQLEITYYTSSGSPITTQKTVPASSRRTVNVNEDAGTDLEISTRIVSDQPIICERPIYFNYGGYCSGGHVVVGGTQ